MSHPTDPTLAQEAECPILARFAIGEESCQDGIGTICIQIVGQDFHVFANGGTLPDGISVRKFNRAQLAMKYALQVVTEIAEQEARDIDE